MSGVFSQGAQAQVGMYGMMGSLAEYILQYGGYFDMAWAAWSEKYNPPPDSAPVLRTMGKQLCRLGYSQVKRVPEPMYHNISKSNIPNFHIIEEEVTENGRGTVPEERTIQPG